MVSEVYQKVHMTSSCEKDFFRLVERGKKKKNSEFPWRIEPHEGSNLRSEFRFPNGDSEFFSLSHVRDKTKNIFL